MFKAETFTALIFLSTPPVHTVSMPRQGLHLLHGGSRRDHQVDIRQLYGVKVELAPSCPLGNGQVPRSTTVEALLLARLDGYHTCYRMEHTWNASLTLSPGSTADRALPRA